MQNDSKNAYIQSEQLISLLYGSIIRQVIDTSQHMTEANHRLEKIGERIGSKAVDQYMKQIGKPCSKIQEMIQRFVTVGVKRYIGATQCRYDQYKLTEKGFSFNLKIINNPLLKNLELTGQMKSSGLRYQSLIQGAIRGALEVMKFKADVVISYENVRGDKNDTIFCVDAVRM